MQGRTPHRAGGAPEAPLLKILPYHPAFGRAVRYMIEERPQPENDETSTGQTIRRMIQYAKEDAGHPSVRQAAAQAAAGARTLREVVERIHRWIRGRVRFVEDATLAGFHPAPEDGEVLIRPADLLRMPRPQGDCDDFSMLTASLLRALGIPAAYATVAADPSTPTYSHVYTIADLPEGPVAVDSSHGRYVGWQVPARGKFRVWPLEKRMGRLGLATPQYTPPPVTDWWSLLNSGINTAGTIFAARYARPELEPGEYQRDQQALYSRTGLYPGGESGAGVWLLLGAAGLIVAIVAIGRKDRR